MLEIWNIGLPWLTCLGLTGKCRDTVEDANDSGPLHWLKLKTSSGSFAFFRTEVVEFPEDASCFQ